MFLIIAVVTALTPALLVQSVRWLVTVLSEPGPQARLVVPVLLTTALAAMGVVMSEVVNMQAQRVARRSQLHLTVELADTVAALPPRRIAEQATQSVIQQCRDSAFLMSGLATSAIDVAASVLTAVTLCASIWTINPLAGVLVALAVIPTLAGFGYSAVFQERMDPPRAEQRRYINYYLEQLMYQRTGTELRTLGASRRMTGMLRDRAARELAAMDALLVGVIRIDVVSGSAVAVLLGGALAALVLSGGGGGGAAAGILGVVSGIAATRGAGFAYGDLMAAAPKVQVLRRLVASVPPLGRQTVAARVDELTLDRVTVRYPAADRPAVDEISLHAEQGEIVALVGANGAGKTTCVNALTGLVPLASGAIRLDRRDAAGMGDDVRLSHFGLLTQEFGRYELTVRDAVSLGAPDEVSDEQVWAALDAARLGAYVATLPLGLDTQLGEQWGGVGLSGGQWQRIALARIHLRGAPVWILDEPTSSIDAETERTIFHELQADKAGRITIVVSHRAHTLSGMDRIYVFDQGRIVEVGDVPALLAARGRFAEMFAEQLTASTTTTTGAEAAHS